MPALYSLLTAVTPNPPSLSDIYDAGVIDTFLDIFRKITEAFTIFPINVFLVLSLVGMACAVIGKAVAAWRSSN